MPDWHRSWFGVAGGGPIIPKDILGGKTYIFANYQGTRFPLSEPFDRLVPSADMRNGILHDPSNPSITYKLNTLDAARATDNRAMAAAMLENSQREKEAAA